MGKRLKQSDRRKVYRFICQVRSFRKKRNWTLVKLSDISGVPANSIWRMERGDVPKLMQAYRIAYALDTTIYTLWNIPLRKQAVWHVKGKAISVRKLRREESLTIEDFSEVCGVSRAKLSQVECGMQPTLTVALMIADAFGVSVYQLWKPKIRFKGNSSK